MRSTLAISMVLAMSMAACSERVRAGRTTASTTAHDNDDRDDTNDAASVADPAAEQAATRAKLAAQRQLQLQRLHDYTLAGQFPINEVSTGYLNVFVDAAGRLCAVANLIHLSGGDALVAATVRKDNYIALRDVHEGPLMDWVLGSGLTHEEVVLIQGIGYEPIVFEIDRAQEQIQRLRDRLHDAEVRLIADTEKSLDVAVARLGAGSYVSTSGDDSAILTKRAIMSK